MEEGEIKYFYIPLRHCIDISHFIYLLRRVCPGSHIGLSFFFLTVSTILATFNISEEVDKSGNAIEPSVEWHSGVIWFVLTTQSNGIHQR